MHVAIVGATGMLGRPVTNELINSGFSIRIVARRVAAARKIFPTAEIVAGDMQNMQSLRDALVGIDVVYLNLSIEQTEKESDFHTETDGLVNLLEAAKQAGIGRIAYLSSIIMRYQGTNGFRWWAFAIKHEAVRLIKSSGISYSIFYPSCFMDSLIGTQRLGRFILLVGQSDVRPWYVSATDYGKQVAQALSIASHGQNQEYIIQGPEPITQHEAAKRFVAAYRKEKLTILTTPPFLMQFGRPFSAQADYGWHITKALNNYPEQFESEQTWLDLGKPETTIEQFAEAIQSLV